jgi:hypothetical protein
MILDSLLSQPDASCSGALLTPAKSYSGLELSELSSKKTKLNSSL